MSDSEQEKAEPKSSTPGEKTGKSKPALGSRNSPVVDTLPELIDIDQVLVSSQGNADAKYSSLPLGTQHTAGLDTEFWEALDSGIPASVKAVLGKMDSLAVLNALTSSSSRGSTAIVHAAQMGNTGILDVLLMWMETRLNDEQLAEVLTNTDDNGKGSLLMAAADGGTHAVFSKVLQLLHGEMLGLITASWQYGASVIAGATRDGGLDTFKAVVKVLDTQLLEDQAMEWITESPAGGSTPLTAAALEGGSRHVFEARLEVLSAALPYETIAQACTASFAACVKCPEGALQGMSVLIAYGAEVAYRDVIQLATAVKPNELKKCFLGAVSSVDNPFIPGMALSATLNDAVGRCRENEERVLAALLGDLDDLLTEVLERLPQSIHTFAGGVDGCAVVFEPETTGALPEGFRGPLRLALEEPQYTETFCVSPLVFEYLSFKFVSGLPDIEDTYDLVGPFSDPNESPSARQNHKRNLLYSRGMVADTVVGRAMQGIGLTGPKGHSIPATMDSLVSVTILPGIQFIVVGIVTRPMKYYKVPAIRMAFDFAVHVFVLCMYTTVVVEVTNLAFDLSETLLTIQVMAEIATELTQMSTGFREYWQDKWNWLESLSLVVLATALWVRLSEEYVDFGRSIFALSAPLVFSRILFFGQVLPHQGIVIQMITIMIGALLQIGVVMGVIMMGFTVGFYALFSEDRSYGDVWLDVFKAMLGEVGVFDEFYDTEYGTTVRLLLVAYLIIMAVLLLNLLIAVLSTEHAKVEEVQDLRFRGSKARVMKLYSRVVDKDLLPAPFNLVQLVVWPFTVVIDKIFTLNITDKMRRAIGKVIFWSVCGPLSILVGWFLWVVSAPIAVISAWNGSNYSTRSLVFHAICCVAVLSFHVFGVPLIFLALLIYSGVSGVKCFVLYTASLVCSNRVTETDRRPHRVRNKRKSSAIRVAEMLKQAPGGLGVREILAYLEASTTSEVGVTQRRAEQTLPATVEHLRRMQNHVEAASKDRGDKFLARIESVDASLTAKIRRLEQRISESVEKQADGLEGRMTSHVHAQLVSLEESIADIAKRLP